MKSDDQPATVIKATPEVGFKIPAPPWDPDYHQHAAGFVGDYRPLAERLAEARR